MPKILTIVPTRGRNQKSKDFAEQFFKTTQYSDLVYGLDDDDEQNYERLPNIIYDINPRLKMNGTLNLLANKYCKDYDYICFMGDDHRPMTPEWDRLLYESIKDKKYGIAYGNDLIKGQRLPTAVFMDSRIIQQLGYMAPPVLIHLYLDNFWKDLGERLKTLVYSPNVILEHLHYIRGKSVKDEIYTEVNSSKVKNHDREEYQKYLENGFEQDLGKLV